MYRLQFFRFLDVLIHCFQQCLIKSEDTRVLESYFIRLQQQYDEQVWNTCIFPSILLHLELESSENALATIILLSSFEDSLNSVFPSNTSIEIVSRLLQLALFHKDSEVVEQAFSLLADVSSLLRVLPDTEYEQLVNVVLHGLAAKNAITLNQISCDMLNSMIRNSENKLYKFVGRLSSQLATSLKFFQVREINNIYDS